MRHFLPAELTLIMDNKGHVAGGLGEEKPATPEIQELCDSVKHQFEVKSGVNAATWKVICYKSQVVAGMMYYVKVDLGGGQFCFLKIVDPLPHTGEKASLSDYQCGKKKEDPICYF
ncbi:leukocyte cysteine proteinase inhibitor 1-like [Bufo gargarizans]|uniref:leukocyte cysteine proteinase inhibitor 1-like n=1 Tax=Bufo gargarizans TaxID=30331 RepID=UPI001CF317D5|nr:leukocyte cysteine proteinase inhibitor 1-like [Bufo gargarizans]